MLTILIMVAPVVVCFLFGMYLDRPGSGKGGSSDIAGPSDSVTEPQARPTIEGSVLAGESDPPARAIRPPFDGIAAKARAKRVGPADRASARSEPYVHPTAVALSMEWSALDQLQLERVLRG